MNRGVFLFIFLLAAFIPSGSHALGIDLDERDDRFRSRVCERVDKRFPDNEKMIQRINSRLLRRFDFFCLRGNYYNSFDIREEEEGTPLAFQKIDLGETEIIFEQSRPVHIARSQGEWETIWNEVINSFQPRPLPEIDFEENIVMVIIGGASSGGNSLKVDSVTETGYRFVNEQKYIRVDVNRIEPKNCGVTLAMETIPTAITIPIKNLGIQEEVMVRFHTLHRYCGENSGIRPTGYFQGIGARVKNVKYLHQFLNPRYDSIVRPSAYVVPPIYSELRGAWENWFSHLGEDAPPVPDVNYSRERVVFISAGRNATPVVPEITEFDDDVRIVVRSNVFPLCEEDHRNQKVIIVPWKDKKIRFVYEESQNFCEDPQS